LQRLPRLLHGYPHGFATDGRTIRPRTIGVKDFG
jgi:hypothetical protein